MKNVDKRNYVELDNKRIYRIKPFLSDSKTITSPNKPVKLNMFDVGLIVGVYSRGFTLIVFEGNYREARWTDRE